MKDSRQKKEANKKKVLITGMGGFAGSHLADRLVKSNYNVYGLVTPKNSPLIEHLQSNLTQFDVDIRDFRILKDVLTEVRPDYIYHLAGISHPPEANKDFNLAYEVNFIGTRNLLEAARVSELDAKILIVSSGEVYGSNRNNELPIKETQLMQPINSYAVTKAGAELLAYQYAEAYGMFIVRARPFNHTGPRQSPKFVCSNFAKQIAEIETGKKTAVINVGNLEAQRDFTDVRDVVNAYQMLIEDGTSGHSYNIGQGKAFRIRDLLKSMLTHNSGMTIEIRKKKSRLRQSDVQIATADTSKIRNELSWKPEIPIEVTLKDLLDYWRKKTGEAAQKGEMR